MNQSPPGVSISCRSHIAISNGPRFGLLRVVLKRFNSLNI